MWTFRTKRVNSWGLSTNRSILVYNILFFNIESISQNYFYQTVHQVIVHLLLFFNTNALKDSCWNRIFQTKPLHNSILAKFFSRYINKQPRNPTTFRIEHGFKTYCFHSSPSNSSWRKPPRIETARKSQTRKTKMETPRHIQKIYDRAEGLKHR